MSFRDLATVFTIRIISYFTTNYCGYIELNFLHHNVAMCMHIVMYTYNYVTGPPKIGHICTIYTCSEKCTFLGLCMISNFFKLYIIPYEL